MPGGRAVPFAIQQSRRQALLRGLDEVDLTLARAAEIEAFQMRDRARRPWIYAGALPAREDQPWRR